MYHENEYLIIIMLFIFPLLFLWWSFSLLESQKLFDEIFFAGVFNGVDQAKVNRFLKKRYDQKMSEMIFHDFFLQL